RSPGVAIRYADRLRGVVRHRRAARSRRCGRIRRSDRHGEDGALRDGVLRDRVLRQVHAVPHRLDTRRRADGSHHRERRSGAEPRADRGALRNDAARLAVRARRDDPLPRAKRDQALPRGFHRQQAGRRLMTSAPSGALIDVAVCHRFGRGIMYAYDYIDPGTPESTAKELVTLEIDGVSVTVPEGTSVMRAAAMLGNRIPKLCATSTLKAFGSCRMCLVEIEGRKGYPASCTTTVAPGMKVRTQSEKLTQLRENVLELYVSDHPLECDTCPANGHCELQDVANTLGITQSRY